MNGWVNEWMNGWVFDCCRIGISNGCRWMFQKYAEEKKTDNSETQTDTDRHRHRQTQILR